MIYILTFINCVGVLYFSTFCIGHLRKILVFLALLFPCLLAAFRDVSIGVDTQIYLVGMYQSASSLSLTDYLSYLSDTASVGWNLMSWIAVNSFRSLSAYMFVVEALCICPIYCALRRLYPGCEWGGVAIWLLLSYSWSLNGMRQSVATGFAMMAFSFVMEKKPLQYLLFCMISFSFHQTAIISFLYYPYAVLFEYNDFLRELLGKWYKAILSFFLAAISIFCIFYADAIIRSLSFLKDSYSFQLVRIGSKNVNYSGAFLFVVFLTIWLRLRGKRTDAQAINVGSSSEIIRPENRISLIYGAVFVGTLLLQLDYVSSSMSRIGLYGTTISIFLASELVAHKLYHSEFKLLIIASIIYYTITILLLNQNGVIPYVSSVI